MATIALLDEMNYIAEMQQVLRFYILIGLGFLCQATSTKLQHSCPVNAKLLADGSCELVIPYSFRAAGSDVSSWRELPGMPIVLHPAKIDLGRYLFFDPLLSKDKNMSCAQCHDAKRSFTDGQKRSLGRNGEVLLRSAPSLWNLAFSSSFFWDGRVSNLEKQVTEPMFSIEEMGNSPENLLAELNQNAEYPRLFSEAFSTASNAKIELSQVVDALASFMRSLTSFDSRYDRYINGDSTALNGAELRGLNVFRSFVTRCAECHTPPLFTNQQIVVTGVPQEPLIDLGAGRLLGDKYKRAFKTPTLRNIAQTAPYMHAGNFTTLSEVVDFYNDGGGRPQRVERVHWHVRKINLSSQEKTDLVTFLSALTDESHLPIIPESVPSGIAL